MRFHTLVSLFIVAGCGGAATSTPDLGGNNMAPLVVQSFGADATSLTAGGELVFSALVSAAARGGALRSSGGAQYALFEQRSSDRWELTLTWAQIHRIAPIEFTSDEQRSFVAEFYDSTGAKATAEARVRLHCDGVAACDGACADLDSDQDHCGACGARCLATCSLGSCVTTKQSNLRRACADVCGDGGMSCSRNCVSSTAPYAVDTTYKDKYGFLFSVYTSDCSAPPAATFRRASDTEDNTFYYEVCCCER